MSRRTSLIGVALASLLILAACISSPTNPSTEGSTPPQTWSFTDGSGKTVELDERPTRIIAHAYAAAALM